VIPITTLFRFEWYYTKGNYITKLKNSGGEYFMTRIHSICIVAILTLFMGKSTQAQQYFDFYPDGKRWDLGLYSGTSLGKKGGKWMTLGGNFDVNAGANPAFGASLSYAISQPFAVQLNVLSGAFANDYDPTYSFRNDYLLFTGRGVVYLNNIAQTWRIYDRINPYVFAGFGRMINRLSERTVPDRSYTVSAFLTGLGLKFYINQTFDLLLNYEYYVANTDIVDGRVANYNRDTWGSVYLGVNINLGSSGRRSVHWEPRDMHVERAFAYYQARVDSVDLMNRHLAARLDERFQSLDHMENRIAELEREFTVMLASNESNGGESVVRVDSDILFAVDCYRIQERSKVLLNMIAHYLLSKPEVSVSIFGHTDALGSAQYNRILSQKRAEAVADYLKAAGIPGSRLIAEGLGSLEPAASNNSEEGRRLNRRVEIIIDPVRSISGGIH
jgi:outer membrane protein OmpA-like peptidoglycan-associated protein